MLRRQSSAGYFALAGLISCVLFASSASAQVPTGTISGRVTDQQGRPVANVQVSIQSPSQQGLQTTQTTANGDYIFKFLPPGRYELTFTGRSMDPLTQSRVVAAGEPVRLDVELTAARVTEAVTVAGDSGAFGGTIEEATSIKQDLMTALPTSRSLSAAASLAPAVHATGPDGALSIGGAMSFENVFMVNGVQIQDNLRRTPFSLYIEDALQETTVTSSGISAEYGRFSGGVVNAVTKSGGNLFSGSLRTSFSNDNWRSVSPFGEPKTDRTVPAYEYTLGGPIVKDRLWFFGAGRTSDRTVARQTGYTNTPYEFRDDEQRAEVKITHAFSAAHRLSVDYTGIRQEQANNAYPNSANVMDLASLTTRRMPQNLLAVHYTGTVGANFFMEAQYSARTFAFEGDGGLSTDRILGTPLRDQGTGAYWWAPNFCGVCAPEKRNNNDLVLKGTYFGSTRGFGSHTLTFGYDRFDDQLTADNHQSASDYHVWATSSFAENGAVYPIIEPGGSTYIIYWPLFSSSKGTNFQTHSLFVNDQWRLNDRWSFNLGVRYDRNAGRDAADEPVAGDSAFSPRLGLAFDVFGDSRTIVNASAGRYVTALANSIAGQGSPAGLPSIVAYPYDGPGINTSGGAPVPSDEALRRVFDWFDQAQPDPFFVDMPGLASRLDGSLTSPHADEVAVGVTQVVGRGQIRVDFINREYGSFYASRIDGGTGQVFDDYGQPYDLRLIQNTDLLARTYRALDVQGNYRINGSTYVGGSYTLSHLYGNVDGESVEAGPLSSGILSYPEYFESSWSFPSGDLSADQRHRARAWATYELPWERIARMSIGAVQLVESGTPYGAVGLAIVSPFVDNPGYALPPDINPYFFSARDAFHTETMYRTDVSFNVERRIGGTRGVDLFAHVQLFNAFNQFQLFNGAGGEINTTVRTAWDDPDRFELFDPFTETPIQGVHWDYGSKFGKAINADAYTMPRTFRFNVGIRF